MSPDEIGRLRLLVQSHVLAAKPMCFPATVHPKSESTQVIDFKNGEVFKLSETPIANAHELVQPLLVPSEGIQLAFKTVRDMVAFTDKRVIAVNVQGLTGKKKDFTSLPYSKVRAFSVETAGHFDRDSELELWFSGLGKVRFEFKGRVDISLIGQILGNYIL